MDDKKLVCKADYEAAKARGKSSFCFAMPQVYFLSGSDYMYIIMCVVTSPGLEGTR